MTVDQPELTFDEEPTPAQPHHLDERTIWQHFAAFHQAHPEVYTELVRLARQGARHRPTLGMKQLFEVLRWNRLIAGLPDDNEAFKLNNNYTSRYARLIMTNEPDLAGVFKVREIRTR